MVADDVDHPTLEVWTPELIFDWTWYLVCTEYCKMGIVDPLLTRMHDQADLWEAQNDMRFVFLRCYAIMSGNMLKALDEGRFQDPVWVSGLLHRFAEYYFNALHRFDRGEDMTPPVWQQVHDASSTRDLHIMQHLLLGINAHINYDLVLALYDKLKQDWEMKDDMRFETRRQDHLLVNEIISETIDTVQDQVIERKVPFMAVVDRLMGRVDEWLLSELISGWRSDVWNESSRLLEAADAEGRERIRNDLEDRVMKKASSLLAY